MKKINLLTLILGCGAMLAGCENGDIQFDDFDYQTVYFATQYAERTVELGEDEFVDLTSDNQHMVNIKAAWGGGYTNRRNVLIDFVVDPSLVEDLYFKNTENPLQVMPSSYYTLPEDMKITIKQGEIMGGVQVSLTDAFFNDPKCVENCYVIPLRMTDVEGADSILSGKALEENPVLTNDAHWSVQPKNFVLYCVKFVNPWHGQYLRRGVDQATINGEASNIVRHQLYVENDEVVDVTTTGYKADVLPVTVKDAAGNNVGFNIVMNFADDNTCTLSTDTEGATLTGTGKFVSKGEKNSLGGKDRDAIYLNYNVELPGMTFATTDTLVLRTRNVYGGATLGVERR